MAAKLLFPHVYGSITSFLSLIFTYTSFMRFLLVDTSDSRGCIALASDAQLLALESHPADADYSSWLLPAAQRTLSAAALNLADLDGYAACSGPGSFTGLRVGLTTVKAWSELFRKPIAAVSRLEALATFGAGLSGLNHPYTAAVLDARRNQVFAALYDSSGAAVEPESVSAPGDFVARVDQRCGSIAVLWRTPDPELLRTVSQWSARQLTGDLLESVAPPFASELAALAHRKFSSGQVVDSLSLDANYVRRSDAELFWKDHASAVKA